MVVYYAPKDNYHGDVWIFERKISSNLNLTVDEIRWYSRLRRIIETSRGATAQQHRAIIQQPTMNGDYVRSLFDAYEAQRGYNMNSDNEENPSLRMEIHQQHSA